MDSPKEGDHTASCTSPAQGKGESGSQKKSLKRTASVPTNVKAKKKRKKAKVTQPARLGYTIQKGEDMLLVISNNQYHDSAWFPPKKKSKKKKPRGPKGKTEDTWIKKKQKRVHTKSKVSKNPAVDTSLQTQSDTDDRWGQNFPEEVLIKVFQIVVCQDGAVPFLCRVARVCHLWNTAASSPLLWRHVTLGYCWIQPGRNQRPHTEKMIKETLTWLACNRLSQLRGLSICHWTKNVNYAIEVMSQSCPHLESLTLPYCKGLTEKAFQSLGLHSQSLQIINLQYSEFQVEGLVDLLESHGSQIKQILFTHGPKNEKILAAVYKGCCPDLELLEINTKLDSKECQLQLCIQALQHGCPKLKTLRMLNVIPIIKVMRKMPESTSGFPLLEELCLATTSFSLITDKDLWDILFDSTKLQVLDLRGCFRITTSGLAALPCLELECLFWDNISTGIVSFPKRGLNMLTQKWSETLRELDITNHVFIEEDLEMAISSLTLATNSDTLRFLNFSGTRITPSAVRSVISRSTGLKYLNLSSCRHLPRGLKRVYRGQEDICQLLEIGVGSGKSMSSRRKLGA
ncbi:F-box/LRR-repeat protein 6-like [Thalassophryne amazonica]|uniref:F-box/LRR-repeat protein 6-like n=1 Tax=Thalassophryne amazonica TaxID=390379 RepID=UPI001470B33E|nr:F-box/LRR-repeat protein 6-like [Thalassophryne amazonica]XP_034017182.1 F-box/LRR-repeat protein 6-like [Thalassophryne amazonica]XP_034017183.1 F-box/LRR-repeat protein 6-like [Thalassophryne amazonica]